MNPLSIRVPIYVGYMKYVSIAFTDRLVSIVYADRCRDIFIDIEDTVRVSLEVLGYWGD